ncbi:hypothetical protein [Denitrificimonas caeni]|uniref:hypothetical protein n=1 Tax=Denitrificimonas caeni TaxID=521720 RepID=UPI001962DAB4|nr:hypothetical protein [Denitrificimonas caeni]
MLESRLRAIIRGTKRGTAYPNETLNNAVKVFAVDMLEYLSIELLEDMSDSTLLSTYLAWEMIAVKVLDPDERLKRVRQCLKVKISPFSTQLEEASTPSNIVSLFSKPLS